MSGHQLRRLWGNAVPILSTNLLESGLVDAKFNSVLTQAAVAAFDKFLTSTSSAPGTAVGVEGKPSSSGRRTRRRVRSSSSSLTKSSGYQSTSSSNIGSTSQSTTRVTSNDNFFEYQRTRGYRLSTPSISDCDAVRQLEEEFIVDVVVDYLRYFEDSSSNGMATLIANTLQTSGIGLSVDLWAAVQRGIGAYHNFHVHEGAIVSGVYYSNCPLGCAPLVLRRPVGIDTCSDLGGDDAIEKDEVTIQPRAGQLLLFPPWISHGVPLLETSEQNKTVSPDLNAPRVSWAFNLNGKLASIGDPWAVTRQ